MSGNQKADFAWGQNWPQIVVKDGEATCPSCGGNVSRLVPTTRIESLWFTVNAEGKPVVEFDTEDYDDDPNSAVLYECDDCNLSLDLPPDYQSNRDEATR